MEKNIIDLKHLNSFLRKNKSVDFRKVDLTRSTSADSYNWNVAGAVKEDLLKQVKAYQRLLRVLPTDGKTTPATMAKALMKKGIGSALEIAAIPKVVFIQENLKVFGGDSDLTAQVYQRAVTCRKKVTLKYLNRAQSLEPHVRAAGLNR